MIAELMRSSRMPWDPKYLRFAVTGALGAVVNTVILYGMTEFLGLFYIFSALIATEISIIFMFFINNDFTFQNRKTGFDIIKGLIKSNIIRSFGIGLNIGLLYIFTEFLGIYYIVSNLMAIFLASIFNFIGERDLNWREDRQDCRE